MLIQKMFEFDKKFASDQLACKCMIIRSMTIGMPPTCITPQQPTAPKTKSYHIYVHYQGQEKQRQLNHMPSKPCATTTRCYKNQEPPQSNATTTNYHKTHNPRRLSEAATRCVTAKCYPACC